MLHRITSMQQPNINKDTQILEACTKLLEDHLELHYMNASHEVHNHYIRH